MSSLDRIDLRWREGAITAVALGAALLALTQAADGSVAVSTVSRSSTPPTSTQKTAEQQPIRTNRRRHLPWCDRGITLGDERRANELGRAVGAAGARELLLRLSTNSSFIPGLASSWPPLQSPEAELLAP